MENLPYFMELNELLLLFVKKKVSFIHLIDKHLTQLSRMQPLKDEQISRVSWINLICLELLMIMRKIKLLMHLRELMCRLALKS